MSPGECPGEGSSSTAQQAPVQEQATRRSQRLRALAQQHQAAQEGCSTRRIHEQDDVWPRKRRRPCPHEALELSLFVRWHSPAGRMKVNRLSLRSVENVDVLQMPSALTACSALASEALLGLPKGVSKSLVARAFPGNSRPSYLVSDDFVRFTPSDEFLSLPGDVARTEFRLVATHEGWEHTLLERELGAFRDPERKMLVTVIEFESTAFMVGQLGLRVSFIAYPVVTVSKAFLARVYQELQDGTFVSLPPLTPQLS